MNLWLTQYFFHPGFLLGGAALIAAPILIHLINRYRYRKVRFAAMEFLMQSQKRNQKKVYLEQLLLLLLRIFIVACIVALVSRLLIDPSQMALFQGAQTHHVVLLDDSGSMQERWEETSAFQQGVAVVQKLVSTGAAAGGAQKFSMILLSQPQISVADYNERVMDETLVSDFADLNESGRIQCSFASPSYQEGLNAVRELLKNDPAAVKQLHIISDFRKGDWLGQTALLNQLNEMSEENIQVNLVQVHEKEHANLGITQLTGALHAVATGVPARLSLTVKNYDVMTSEKVRVTLTLDGNRLPMTIDVPKLPPGESSTEEFDLVFTSPGPHELVASLPADALAQDNERYLAVNVGSTNPILIVDETTGGEEGQYLADALSAAPGVTGFTASVTGVDYLRKNPLDGYVLIYLINVGSLPDDALVALEDYVRSGGGLAWFAGDAIRPDYYNEALFRGGQGLYPVKLGNVVHELQRDPSGDAGPDLKLAADYPAFSVLAAENGLLTYYISIFKSLSVASDWDQSDVARGDRVRTLALLRDQMPLMFEKPFGKGRIFASLTSAGPMLNQKSGRWNNWPQDPNAMSYTIFHLELAQHLMKTDRRLPEKIVGEPIDVQINPAKYFEEVELSLPTEEGVQIVRVMATPDPGNETTSEGNAPVMEDGLQVAQAVLRASNDRTSRPGFYQAKLTNINRQVDSRLFAFNAPPGESELQISSSVELLKRLGPESKVHLHAAEETAWLQPQQAGQEVRKFLLVLLVAILLLEQVWSYRLSYHATGGMLAGAQGGRR